jgi:hypothetical protein
MNTPEMRSKGKTYRYGTALIFHEFVVVIFLRIFFEDSRFDELAVISASFGSQNDFADVVSLPSII